MEDTSKNSIEYYGIYHKIIYFSMIVLTVATYLLGFSHNKLVCFSYVGILVLFMILDTVFYHMNWKEKKSNIQSSIRLIEIVVYSIYISFIPSEGMLLTASCIFLVVLILEYLLSASDYDSGTIMIRKLFLIIPLFMTLCLALHFRGEKFWFCYVIAFVVLTFVIFVIIDRMVYENHFYETHNTKLIMEKNSIDAQNKKLVEYQERVKSVNEKVNFQKIELARLVNDLKNANHEIESQTDVMRYMASSFDLNKNINVIVDAVMDVKNPKLCAVFLEKEVLRAEYPTCVIRTDYTSMERRLSKDIEKIYREFVKTKELHQIITGEQLKEYRFIGETNIQSMAFISIIDEQNCIGFMLVASNEENFFEKGLSYYETCLLEFRVSVKSTKLYLQTQDMARKDGLTQIYNRLYFGEWFKNACAHAEQKKESLAVALFDIDKFKNVNDTYGHLAGDQVIKMVASIDDKYANKYNGFACRFGGEEFLLILPGHDEKSALPILEEMHNEIKNTLVEIGDIKISVNVCIGLTAYPTLCDNTDIIINRADTAMYYGKKNGRGRLVVDDPNIHKKE